MLYISMYVFVVSGCTNVFVFKIPIRYYCYVYLFLWLLEVYIYICIWASHDFVYMYILLHTYKTLMLNTNWNINEYNHICTCYLRERIHICVHTCIRVYMLKWKFRRNVFEYIHIFSQTHTSTRKHIYIYTYT